MKMVMAPSILFLTNSFPDFDSSYRGIFIGRMATLLKDEGYPISVVTPKIYKRSHYFEELDGIKVYRFPFFAGDKLLIEYENIPYIRMIIYYLTGLLWAFYVILRNGCDMIHIHWAIPTGLIGVLVRGILKKPVIVTIHGSDLRMALERPGLLGKVFAYVCQNAAYLNCVSDVQKRELERLGIPDDRISTIPMGIDEAFLEKGDHRGRAPKEGPATILSNRNLLPIYNVSLLIRAIPIVLQEEPNTKFLIAGDGPERENLEREARDLKVSHFVKFLGRVPHEKMANLLGQTDIFVSTSSHDGTSVSLLEAMGSGAFPIVTDIPSNREWISEGENGFLVPTDEERFLAEKILEAIRNQDLREGSRGKNISLVKEKALWPVTIAKTKEIYKMVLDSKR
jgi:glycosyltransferase involved in cell wall biosynthesis